MKNCGIFFENIYKIVRFADTIIIHSSSFIFHYSFIFLQQLQSDKFQFDDQLTNAENRDTGKGQKIPIDSRTAVRYNDPTMVYNSRFGS